MGTAIDMKNLWRKDRMKYKRYVALTLAAVFAVFLAVRPASAQESRGYTNPIPEKGSSPEEWRQWHREQLALAKRLGIEEEKYGIHNGNRVETIFYNYGTISAPGTALDVVWPKGSQQGYGFEFGVIAGAEVRDINGARRHVLSEHISDGGDRSPGGVPWGWTPIPGYAAIDQPVLAMSDCEDNDGPDGIPNSGDDDGVPDCWPQAEDYQEWGMDPNTNPFYDSRNDRYWWPGEYGKDVLTADQESYYWMNDKPNREFKYYPYIRGDYERMQADVDAGTEGDSLMTLTDQDGGFSEGEFNLGTGPASDVVVLYDNEAERERYYYVTGVESSTELTIKKIADSPQSQEESWTDITYSIRNGQDRGLGLEVESRGYQWAHTLAQDCIFFIYDFENIGDDTLNQVYFSMYGDPHVGGQNDYADDDSDYDTKIDMVYSWDHDQSGDGGFKPGYFGYSFLESPGNPDDGKDNDEDGMVDESMQDGIDNDGDWDSYTDYNNNGRWDEDEPLNDDLGRDGLGPLHNSYISPDEGEGDGMPTPGEPDFDETDLDESDQIGLTSFSAMIYGNRITPGQDESFWNVMTQGIIQSEINQTTDNIFLYSSGPITMVPGQRRRFSIALLMGNNEADLFRSANTVQDIYNAGYRFVKAPNKPNLTAVPGDGRVTLYWDSRAERSYDPLYGNDFEGYAVYRATDIGFNEVFNITDAQGNPQLWSPIARFDKDNELSGPHPIEQVNGIHYYLGDNTGLSHSYVDSTAMNGQRYFYAVVAYDSGSVEDNISPTETTKSISVQLDGSIETDVNTAMVYPSPASAGYKAPKIEEPEDDRHSGPGTGKITTTIVNPEKVRDGITYEVRFTDSATDGVDNDGDWTAFSDDNGNGSWDTGEALNDDVGADGINSQQNSSVAPDEGEGDGEPTPGEPNFEHRDFQEMVRNTVSYSMYDLTNGGKEILSHSRHLDGSDSNPVLHGLQLRVRNDTLETDMDRSGWIAGDANHTAVHRVYPQDGIRFPADYHIMVRQDSAYTAFNSKSANFVVWNATDHDLNGNGEYDAGEPLTDFVFFDINSDGRLSVDDRIVFLAFEDTTGNPTFRGTWQMEMDTPTEVVSDAVIDLNGHYWFATDQGIVEYFDGEWTEHQVGGGVRDIYVNAENYKLLAMNDGLKQYRFGELQTISDGVQFNTIAEDNLGRIWLATATAELILIDGQEVTYFEADSANGTEGPLSADSRALTVDQDNNVWVGTTRGLSYYDGSAWNPIDLSSLSSQIVESLYADGNGTIWIGTLNELARYSNGAVEKISETDGMRIRDIALDADGMVWSATPNGVLRGSVGGNWEVTSTSPASVAPSANDIRMVERIDDVMYVGTTGGLDYFTDGSWETYNPQRGDIYRFATQKEFSHYDSYTFSTDSQFVDQQEAGEDLSDVAVVPNPYVATAVWEPRPQLLSGRGERRIWFINLPKEGTIRIFTVSGELLKTIEFQNDQRNGSVSWDLLNDDRLEIAYGVYLYQVESPYGEAHGKFAIVK